MGPQDLVTLAPWSVPALQRLQRLPIQHLAVLELRLGVSAGSGLLVRMSSGGHCLPPPPSVSSECLKGSYITYVVGSDLCQETTLVNVTPGGHIFCIASWRSKLLYLHISIIRETFPKGTVVTSLLGRGDEITPPPRFVGIITVRIKKINLFIELILHLFRNF